MAEVVTGAVVGLAFTLAWELLKDISTTTVKFSSELKQLKSTMSQLKPIIKVIVSRNEELDDDERKASIETLYEWLKDGAELLRKCSRIQVWNLYKRCKHSKKMRDLDGRLSRFCNINLPLLSFSDQGEALELLKHGSRGSSFSNSCGVLDLPDLIVGLKEPVEELKMLLLKDGVQVVVVSAPGGYGKSTLAKMLCHDQQIQGKFENRIIFVNVGQNANFKDIVQTLFQHFGYQAPNFHSDEHAKGQLENLLKKNGFRPVLLVLDDVWVTSDTETPFHNFMLPIPGYKILVTSRFIFKDVGSTYEMKLLNYKNAKTLFCHSAFPNNNRTFNVRDDLIDEVVKGCRGNPLVLEAVGGSLRGKHEVVWRDTLRKWSEGQSLFDSHKELLARLQTSLDVLDEMPIVKECYLDLSLFPDDQRISASALLDMWVEMYNLDEEGMSTLMNLLQLSNRSLVNLYLARNNESGFDGYCNGHFVMQHDLLRELAIHHSNHGPLEQWQRITFDIRNDSIPKDWIEKMHKPIHARFLSILTDEKSIAKWHSIQLPEVEALMLNLWARNFSLPQFMGKIDRLKVLIIANCGCSTVELNNISLLGYLYNLKRIRLEHVTIPPFSVSVLQLKSLRKISLIMCKIGMTFNNCTIAVPDIWPNIDEMDIEYCDELEELPEGICNIVHLKKLRVTYCQELVALPEGLGNLTNLELLSVYSCTSLSNLPESIGSLQKLKFLDISACPSLRILPARIGELGCLGILNMRGCEGLYDLPLSVMYLKQLEDVICDEDKRILWKLYLGDCDKPRVNVVAEEKNLNWLHKLHH